jgi:outer membrane protein assembly factor BamB
MSRAIRVFAFQMAILAAAWSHLATPSVAAENWPQFRGLDGLGASDAADLPETWSKTENVVWSTEIPGRGWSCPIVWGDRIFLTSAIKLDGKEEKITKGLYFGGERKTPKEPHRWTVTCIDFKGGKILWEKTAFEGIPKEGHHLKNTLASETPVTDGKQIYAYFGNVGLVAYTLDAELVWKKELPAYRMANNWGTAISPVLHGDRLFIVNDNEKQSFVAAYETKTGKEIWRNDRKERSNWATPCVWQNEVRTELVTCGKNKIRSYSLDGKLLWEMGGMSSITIPTPFASHGLLYATSGYVLDYKHKPIFAIRPGASGDISLKDNETSNKFIAWFQPQGGPYNVSPVMCGDTLYVLYDRGLFAGYNALTGKPLYQPAIARLSGSSQYTASPWSYHGKIFCLSEDGDTSVIPAGPKLTILRKNSLDELCMATPAISRGSLFIRTETKLYRIASQRQTASKEPRTK